MAIRSHRYGANTGTTVPGGLSSRTATQSATMQMPRVYAMNPSPQVRGAHALNRWQESASQAIKQGGRVVTSSDFSKQQIVSPAGQDWGTFDYQSGKDTRGTLRRVSGEEGFQDITHYYYGD
jgi:hypothetical protein